MPNPKWKEEYNKRFLEKTKLSDGSSTEYIALKGTALDKDFQDFVASLLESVIEDIPDYEVWNDYDIPLKDIKRRLREVYLQRKD